MADTLFVATRKGLFRLERGAGRWGIEHVSFLGDGVMMVLPDPRDGSIYAGMGLGHYGAKMRRSRDGGRTWDDIGTPVYPKPPEDAPELLPDGRPLPSRLELIWSLEAGPASRPGLLWCGTIPGGLFRSTDHGASWQLVRALWEHPKRKEWFGGGADYPGIHSICVEDEHKVTLGVSCGGVWRTTDGGESWELRADGMYAAFMPPERTFDPAIQDPHRLAQCPARPEVLWAQHHNGVFRTTDGGRSWHDVPNVPPSTFGFAVAVHPRDPDVAWLVPAQKDECRVPVDAKVVVARTRDGGESWDVLRNGLPQEHAYDLTLRHALDVDATGDKLAFGSTTGSLWLSDDQGDTWERLPANLPPIYCVRFVK